MKKYIVYLLFAAAPLVFSGHAYAGSNNGYTSGANVYTGSSSRTWYGGGVAHVLAEWRKEADVPEEVVPTPVKAEEGEDEAVEGTSAMDAHASPDMVPAPETPVAPEKPEATMDANEATRAVEPDAPVAPEMPVATVEEGVVPKAHITEGKSTETTGVVTPIPLEEPKAVEAPDYPIEPKMDRD